MLQFSNFRLQRLLPSSMKSSKKGETRSRSRNRGSGGIEEEEEEELQKVEEGNEGVDWVFQVGAAGVSAQKQRRWKE